MAGKRDIDYSLRYALSFKSKKLRTDLEKIARAEDRALNYIINIACEEFIHTRKLEER